MIIGVKMIPLYNEEQLEKMAKEPEPMLSNDFILLLLGGRWPRYKGFHFEEAYGWKINGNLITPCDFCGTPMRLPSFMLIIVDIRMSGKISLIKRKIVYSDRPTDTKRGVKIVGEWVKESWLKNPKEFMLDEDFVLILLGGEWPEYKIYKFEYVAGWKIEGNQLSPCDFARDEIAIPNFMLAVVDNLNFDPPKIIKPKIV